jgi:hypothetical protein
MKFMMNGALTLGTLDGATIEMVEEAGDDNFFLFGLTTDQVADSRNWYNPHWHYDNEPETRRALDLIFSGHFNPTEPGIFEPLRGTLLDGGDPYMHLADLTAYLDADRRLLELYADPGGWAQKAIMNIASSGRFSSDRTIAQYAGEIWQAKPCPVVLSEGAGEEARDSRATPRLRPAKSWPAASTGRCRTSRTPPAGPRGIGGHAAQRVSDCSLGWYNSPGPGTAARCEAPVAPPSVSSALDSLLPKSLISFATSCAGRGLLIR